MLIKLDNINKSFPNQDLFKGLDFSVKENDKIAIIGANGVGKTSLFRIIAQEETIDSGKIYIKEGLRMGFLEQEVLASNPETVSTYFKKAYQDLIQMKTSLVELEKRMVSDHSEKTLSQYARLQEEFLRRGGYDVDHEIKILLHQFSFDESVLNKRMDEFSGGQLTRLAFIRLLLSKPDVLFLDEPTNHLDFESLSWLEGYLRSYPSALVFISHDREFINNIARTTVEITQKKAIRFEGNYSEYQSFRKSRIDSYNRKYQDREKEIARLEKQIERFRKTSSKASFIRSKEKYIDRIRMDEIEEENYHFSARFKSRVRGGEQVLQTQDLSIGYKEELLRVNMDFLRGNRYVLVGKNGSGKSSFLKTISGEIEALSGEMLLGHQIEMGYFDQQLLNFNLDKTVLEEVWDEFPSLNHSEIRQSLAQFLFDEHDIFKELSVLSGGEKVRLSLLKLMLAQNNFILLDEPTNHLDIYGREALEEALMEFDGTMIIVSHDRYFINKIASDLLIIRNRELIHEKISLESHFEQEEKAVNSVKVSRKNERKERKKLQNRHKKLSEILTDLEEDLEVLRESRFDPDFYHDYEKMNQLNQAIDDVHNEIADAENEWLEISLILEED